MIPRVSHFRTTHIGVQQTVDRLRRAVNVAVASLAQDVGKTKVNGADTTLGYLLDKFVAGTNITLSQVTPGGNDQIRIDAAGGGTDELVKVSAADTTAAFLIPKLLAGAGVSLVIVNAGGNEQLRIDATTPAAVGGSGITPEGGLYFTAINDTGEVSVKGKVVHPSPAVDLAVSLVGLGEIDPVGVIYDAGVPVGGLIRVVANLWADVLIEPGDTIQREYWIGAPTSPAGTVGHANCIASPPSATVHFQEMGHCFETKPNVYPTLARCILHQN